MTVRDRKFFAFVAVISLGLATGLVGCGGSGVGSQGSQHLGASSEADSTDRTSPSAQDADRPSPPSDADLAPSENHNDRGTPLGLLCWSATQVALDMVALVSVSPLANADSERSMIADVQAFKETLRGSLDELPSVADQLPDGTLPFYDQFYGDLSQADRALSSNEDAILEDPMLAGAHLSGLFLYEEYDGYRDFAVLAEEAQHGCRA